MIINFDFESFLKNGTIMDLNSESVEHDIVNLYGDAEEIEEYGKKGKYLHYGNLRFSFSQSKLSGIDLLLFNSEISIKQVFEDDTFIVDKDTELITLLLLLNNYELKWNIPWEKSQQDYLVLEISSGLKIYYYFYNSKIERISRGFY